MTHDVHIYTLVRVTILGVPSSSLREAITTATQINLADLLNRTLPDGSSITHLPCLPHFEAIPVLETHPLDPYFPRYYSPTPLPATPAAHPRPEESQVLVPSRA